MDLLMMPLNPRKLLKEEFVSNLTGSSMLEIAALSVIVPTFVVLRQWSSSCYKRGHAMTKDASGKMHDAPSKCYDSYNFAVQVIKDFVFVIMPVICAFTVLADWTYVLAIILILLLLFCISAKRLISPGVNAKVEQHSLLSLRMSILSYRVAMVVVTCLCILAVDFKIFPRRYAKTETYGTSLMDLGVGSFVVANSLVSRQARGDLFVNWKVTLRSASPLVLLGAGRLVSMAGVNYQVHVGEYGVHWNFFFTLAAVSLLSSIIPIHPKYCGIFGAVILVVYQVSLIYGLNGYLLSNQRGLHIIDQNKEGLFSIFGYWGMYMISLQLGYCIFFASAASPSAGSSQHARTRVWILCILFWFLTVILDKHVERVSRRMCNLAYVTFVLAQNLQVLSVLMLSDIISGQRPLLLEEVFNCNLLGTFLLANVLTGIINLSFDTLSAASAVAFVVLVGYALLLTAFASTASFHGIKLKF
ncbi:Uncharacterized protein AXF42_Ash020491 [Apostasia shenzhenica]|uniref:GPI-anchored wall transfer protein n=1 Tax=Apostasia shenzhenica TaxID=1088818 RepID=A0A2H9ZZ99_9ASPA|nr:Uncharacterized protein AXF42_Ash020491 [Apostasia shenzhenica]